MKEEDFNKKLFKIFKFNKKAKNIFKEQYKNFNNSAAYFKKSNHNYKIGDEVILKKHNLMRGENARNHNLFEKIDFISKIGFISPDFTGTYNKNQKTPLTIPVWNIREDIKLKDYIINYSGATIRYYFVENRKTETKTNLIPFNKLNEILEISKDDSFFKWDMEQTKEVRFMPSLARNMADVAFIMDLNNEYGKKILENDIYNLNFPKEVLKSFIPEFMIKDYIYGKRDDFTTNRESAIIYGIPSSFITGLLVSKKLESNKEHIAKLQRMFPSCFIANLDGVVISV